MSSGNEENFTFRKPANDSDLDAYGVWVKSGPKDIIDGDIPGAFNQHTLYNSVLTESEINGVMLKDSALPDISFSDDEDFTQSEKIFSGNADNDIPEDLSFPDIDFPEELPSLMDEQYAPDSETGGMDILPEDSILSDISDTENFEEPVFSNINDQGGSAFEKADADSLEDSILSDISDAEVFEEPVLSDINDDIIGSFEEPVPVFTDSAGEDMPSFENEAAAETDFSEMQFSEEPQPFSDINGVTLKEGSGRESSEVIHSFMDNSGSRNGQETILSEDSLFSDSEDIDIPRFDGMDTPDTYIGDTGKISADKTAEEREEFPDIDFPKETSPDTETPDENSAEPENSAMENISFEDIPEILVHKAEESVDDETDSKVVAFTAGEADFAAIEEDESEKIQSVKEDVFSQNITPQNKDEETSEPPADSITFTEEEAVFIENENISDPVNSIPDFDALMEDFSETSKIQNTDKDNAGRNMQESAEPFPAGTEQDHPAMDILQSDIPELTEGGFESFDLDAFMPDSTPDPERPDTGFESLDLDSFMDDFNSQDSGAGSAAAQEEELYTEKPIDINLKFDDEFLAQTVQSPEASLDFQSSDIEFSLDNIEDISIPDVSDSGETVIPETAEQKDSEQNIPEFIADTGNIADFDDVSDFNDILSSIDASIMPEDTKAATVPVKSGTKDYNLTVSEEDAGGIEGIKSDTVEDDSGDEEITVALYTDNNTAEHAAEKDEPVIVKSDTTFSEEDIALFNGEISVSDNTEKQIAPEDSPGSGEADNIIDNIPDFDLSLLQMDEPQNIEEFVKLEQNIEPAADTDGITFEEPGTEETVEEEETAEEEEKEDTIEAVAVNHDVPEMVQALEEQESQAEAVTDFSAEDSGTELSGTEEMGVSIKTGVSGESSLIEEPDMDKETAAGERENTESSVFENMENAEKSDTAAETAASNEAVFAEPEVLEREEPAEEIRNGDIFAVNSGTADREMEEEQDNIPEISAVTDNILEISELSQYNETDPQAESAGTISEEEPDMNFDDVSALEHDLYNTGNTEKTPDSQQLLVQIAAELSSIRNEISSLKDELDVIKTQAAAVPASDKDNSGFFGNADEDETIALTGEELNNILINADFTEETAETPDEEENFNADITEDNISGKGEPAFSEARDEPYVDENFILPESASINFDEELQEPSPEELQFTDTEMEENLPEEEINVPKTGDILVESDMDLGNMPAEDILEEDFFETSDTEIASEINEENLAYLTEDSVEDAAEEVQEIELAVEDNPEDSADGMDASGEDFPEETEEMIPEISVMEDTEADFPAEDGFEASAEIKENNTEYTRPQEEPSVADIPIEEETADTAEETIQEVLLAEAAYSADETLELPEEQIVSGEEEPPAEPRSEYTDSKASFVPSAPESLPVQDNRHEEGVIPGELKDEIKSVLRYMDQLLENLPEDKIEEFARSEHFEIYKKLFRELGLS